MGFKEGVFILVGSRCLLLTGVVKITLTRMKIQLIHSTDE